MRIIKQAVTHENILEFGLPAHLDYWRSARLNPIEMDGQWLWSCGTPWHTDESHCPFTALLVVNNDGFTVETRDQSVVPKSGDLVIFNIHQEHRATGVGEILCLVHDFETEPTDKEALDAIVNY
jgi:hypothetical protein